MATAKAEIRSANRPPPANLLLAALPPDDYDRLAPDLEGATRPTVTIVAGTLQRAGLITYQRGHVTIVDRERSIPTNTPRVDSRFTIHD